ncbi:MAG: 3'-5' exonuclease, partial [Rhodospirillales bacterium]
MSFPPSKSGLSALPLASLPAIVLDTETTGLDTLNDRIIEIGAVRIRNGVQLDETIAAFIAPGIPVPPKSTAIHGIRDADLADAEPFADVMARFVAWAGSDVVIGYSLGFDLTI